MPNRLNVTLTGTTNPYLAPRLPLVGEVELFELGLHSAIISAVFRVRDPQTGRLGAPVVIDNPEFVYNHKAACTAATEPTFPDEGSDVATLPEPARDVVRECIREAWTNTEQNDATTAADVAADVAQRLYFIHRVRAAADDNTPADDDPKLALWFTPGAIRDHFEADEPNPTEDLSDETLRRVGEAALTADGVYKAFHEALAWALDEADVTGNCESCGLTPEEQDDAPCCTKHGRHTLNAVTAAD